MFNPQYFYASRISYRGMVDGLLDGIRAAERDFGTSCLLIPSIDRQMARAGAVQAQDPPAAGALWQKVEHEILAQAPMVPTYNRQVVDFVSKRVGNYEYHPQWGALLDQLWVK